MKATNATRARILFIQGMVYKVTKLGIRLAFANLTLIFVSLAI